MTQTLKLDSDGFNSKSLLFTSIRKYTFDQRNETTNRAEIVVHVKRTELMVRTDQGMFNGHLR